MEHAYGKGSRYARRSRAGAKRAAEGMCAALFERSPFPVWVLDLSRGAADVEAAGAARAVDANPAAVEFHGAASKGALLASFGRLLGPEAGSFWEKCAKAAGERPLEARFEAEVSTLAGSRRAVRASLAPEPGCERSLERVLVTLEDISELRRAEAVGRARLALMNVSLSCGIDELTEAAVDLAESITDSQIGFFHFVAEDGRTLILQNWSKRTKGSYCVAQGKGSHYDIDKAGVWVECVRAGGPVIHNDYSSLSGRKGLPPGHAPVVRELVVPVTRGGKVAAILGVGNKAAPYDAGDAAALSKLADFAWEIVERKRAEETLKCLATSFASLSGREFFDAAARRLAQALFVDRILVAELVPGAASLAVLGESGPDGGLGLGSIPLDGSPFEAVASGGEPFFGDRLLELFPEDALVAASGANSLSVRALGGGGATAIVAALDSRPMRRADRIFPTIDLFKDRILAELARLGAERALEELNSELEAKVRVRSLELERAAKLAMLGRLVAGIAHELSTPLAAISSANESLGESMGRCIPGLPGFLGGAGREEGELFSRLIAALVSNRGARSEAELRARKRRWRAAARAAGISGADHAIDMLADIGDDPSDGELVGMLRMPRSAEVVGKAFLIARSMRASSVIGAAADKASRTVRALKTYAHEAPSDRLEAVDLRESVESAISLYFTPLPSGPEIAAKYEPTPPALAQPDRLSQVWVNIIGNAMQASPGKARIEILVRPEGGRALVSIRDEGPGIPDDLKDRVFTPFFTTKAPGEGLGLGLDICKRIVDEFGGSIWFESAPGRTVFSVALPLAGPEARCGTA
jgi:signal transduction histidine kinase